MIIKKATEIKREVVTKANSTETTIQWLITKEDGAERFTMRRFEIQPGGQIGIHSHPEEHEIYILQGTGKLIDESGDTFQVHEGNVVFVPPNEPHGYRNDGNDTLAFICVIPYLAK
jgi:quercetin dioxygenase-like cupin family protein